MFAPKIAKAQTKASDSPTRKLAPQPSLVARPLGGGAVEQARVLQGTIGNQAMLRLLAQRTSNLTKNRPEGDHEQEADPANLTSRGATPGVSWDLTQIPVFPPDRLDQPQPLFALTRRSLPSTIQPKLAVGPVDDPLEHEADRIADHVIRMPAPVADPAWSPVPRQVSRKYAACEEKEKLQNPPAGVHEALRSPGQPLDAAMRAYFEPRFGQDFSSVRVHSGPAAAQSARDLNAKAYTVGHDIVFNSRHFMPGTREGGRLLAHELTHVIQQSVSDGTSFRRGDPPATVPRSGGQVQRAPLPAPTRAIRSREEIDREAAPLAEKVADRLDHWKNQAYWSVQDFVNEELERRIDALRGKGLTIEAFLQSLLGNLIWAAACFLGDAPMLVFVISSGGIAVAASAQPPSASKPADVGAVSGLAVEVQRSLDRIEKEMRGTDDRNLLKQAEDLILFNPDLSGIELLEVFMTRNFDRSILQTELGGKLTGFDDEKLKDTQKRAIETRFQHFIDVVPLVGSKTEPGVGGGYTLSLVHILGVGGGDYRLGPHLEPPAPDKPENEKWGIGYVIKPRHISDGKFEPGEVAIAKWVEEDTVDAVRNRMDKLKMSPITIEAFATEVSMGPETFKAHEERLRKELDELGPD